MSYGPEREEEIAGIDIMLDLPREGAVVTRVQLQPWPLIDVLQQSEPLKCACYCGCPTPPAWRAVTDWDKPPSPFCSSGDGYYGVGPFCRRCGNYAVNNMMQGFPWCEVSFPSANRQETLFLKPKYLHEAVAAPPSFDPETGEPLTE